MLSDWHAVAFGHVYCKPSTVAAAPGVKPSSASVLAEIAVAEAVEVAARLVAVRRVPDVVVVVGQIRGGRDARPPRCPSVCPESVTTVTIAVEPG